MIQAVCRMQRLFVEQSVVRMFSKLETWRQVYYLAPTLGVLKCIIL